MSDGFGPFRLPPVSSVAVLTDPAPLRQAFAAVLEAETVEERAHATVAVERLLESFRCSDVHAMRLAGSSWAAVGRAYGISRQAAQQRAGNEFD